MVGEVFGPNSKSVVHFILVDFGRVGLEFDIKKIEKKIWSKKNFIGHKKFVDPEFFHPKKKFGLAKFLVRRYFKSKKIGVQRKLMSQKI